VHIFNFKYQRDAKCSFHETTQYQCTRKGKFGCPSTKKETFLCSKLNVLGLDHRLMNSELPLSHGYFLAAFLHQSMLKHPFHRCSLQTERVDTWSMMTMRLSSIRIIWWILLACVWGYNHGISAEVKSQFIELNLLANTISLIAEGSLKISVQGKSHC
jgi:hypothetical protein